MSDPPSSNPGEGGLMRPLSLGSRLSKPPSYNEILPRLYLGDIATATNKDTITRLCITDIITVEIQPLPPDSLASCIKRYLFINVMDCSKQDILSHFETSNEFIESALKDSNNRVLVHCVAGISRSASLVIAYLMKSRSMNFTEAHDIVARRRRIVAPNEGFVKQLVLYSKMGCKIDIGNIEYRRVVLEALVFEFRLMALNYYHVPGAVSRTITSPFSGLIASTSSSSSRSMERTNIVQVPASHRNMQISQNIGIFFDHFYNKLHLQEVSKYPQVYDPGRAFRCTKCRSIVFYEISVIANKRPANYEQVVNSINSDHASSKSSIKSQTECPFIFIEPQPWMSRSVLERDGNLECYKCKRKLGKFDWTSGESCSCATHNSHLNLNLFKIMRKKVDASIK